MFAPQAFDHRRAHHAQGILVVARSACRGSVRGGKPSSAARTGSAAAVSHAPEGSMMVFLTGAPSMPSSPSLEQQQAARPMGAEQFP